MVALACERDFQFYPKFFEMQFLCDRGRACLALCIIINCNKFYLIMLTFATKLDALELVILLNPLMRQVFFLF